MDCGEDVLWRRSVPGSTALRRKNGMQIFTAEDWKEIRTGQNECRNNVEPLFLAGVTTVSRAGIRPAPILSRHDTCIIAASRYTYLR